MTIKKPNEWSGGECQKTEDEERSNEITRGGVRRQKLKMLLVEW
jgi:hypothetical protein